MMRNMKRTLLACVLALGCACAAPAYAQDEDEVLRDARFDGYNPEIKFDSGGAAINWFLLLGCGIISLGVMFINAKRTHLD